MTLPLLDPVMKRTANLYGLVGGAHPVVVLSEAMALIARCLRTHSPVAEHASGGQDGQTSVTLLTAIRCGATVHS